MSSRRASPLILLAILGLAALRLIHLEADTPPWVGTGSMGVYVDEGYKTLSPRNEVLYGVSQWHPDDIYPGWKKQSPLTHSAFRLTFAAFGTRLGSARLISVFSFALFLLAYAYGTARDYPPWLFMSGLLLLGITHSLFFFSRIALLEIHLTLVLYSLLFLLRRWWKKAPAQGFLLVLLFSTAATFGIKRTAFLYFLPVFLAILPTWWLHGRGTSRVKLLAGLGLFAAPAAWAFKHRDLLADRVDWPLWWEAPRNVVLNPLTYSSALLVSAGLLCALLTLLVRHRELAETPYRTALLALVLLGPCLFFPFPYDPLRYYIPLLPAYLLLPLEWLAGEDWRRKVPQHLPSPFVGAGILTVCWTLLCLAQAFDKLLLTPFGLRGEHHHSTPFLFPLLTLPALLCGIFLWNLRHRLFTGQKMHRLVVALLCLAALRDTVQVGRFLAQPSFRSREIATALARIVPPDASVAGDWAPFLTFGSGRRALYITEDQNEPYCIGLLRPDFLLWSDTDDGRRTRKILREELRGVELEKAAWSWSYAQREVILYPITYEDPEVRWPDCPSAPVSRDEHTGSL